MLRGAVIEHQAKLWMPLGRAAMAPSHVWLGAAGRWAGGETLACGSSPPAHSLRFPAGNVDSPDPVANRLLYLPSLT